MGLKERSRAIVYITTGLGVGGAEAMLVRLATAHPSLAEQIVIATLLPAEAYLVQLRQAGVTVVELDFRRPGGIVTGVVTLAKLLARMQPDIVQGWMYHGDLTALIALLMSGRRRATSLIWSIRCSDMDFHHYGVGLRLVVKACTHLSRYPDLVTANSRAGMKFHLKLGYRPRRAEIVANGIDVEQFKPDPVARNAVRAELGLEADAVVLAHVARVDPMKDHESFLSAMKQLPALRALLIGSGTENLPAAANIIRLGRCDDIPRLMAAADFIVSSSRFGEGFSNAVAEGMACGLPAIATNVGDTREIVGDTGLVVPPGDVAALVAATSRLSRESRAIRSERGARARARIVENYSMARALEQWRLVYEAISQQSPNGSPSSA